MLWAGELKACRLGPQCGLHNGPSPGMAMGALPVEGVGLLAKPDWLSAADGGWSGSAHGLEACSPLLTKPGPA